jgi:hypothetical protein
VRRLLLTASVVPSSPILVTLIKEALSSSETLVLTRATRRNIPEDTILHSHRRENLKSYNLTLLFHQGQNNYSRWSAQYTDIVYILSIFAYAVRQYCFTQPILPIITKPVTL